MPRIGRYSYPVIGLDEAIALVKVLQDKCGGEATRGTFSEAIGKKGGWFNYLVGALSDYGLVDAQSGRVKITELAKKILFGITTEERETAKVEAARKIRLFVDINEKYPQGATLEQFTLFLRDNSGADLEKIKTEAPKAYKVYKEVLKYLKAKEHISSQPLAGQIQFQRSPEISTFPTLPEGVDLVVISRDYGMIYVKDEAGVKLLEVILSAIKQKLGMQN